MPLEQSPTTGRHQNRSCPLHRQRLPSAGREAGARPVDFRAADLQIRPLRPVANDEDGNAVSPQVDPEKPRRVVTALRCIVDAAAIGLLIGSIGPSVPAPVHPRPMPRLRWAQLSLVAYSDPAEFNQHYVRNRKRGSGRPHSSRLAESHRGYAPGPPLPSDVRCTGDGHGKLLDSRQPFDAFKPLRKDRHVLLSRHASSQGDRSGAKRNAREGIRSASAAKSRPVTRSRWTGGVSTKGP